MVVNLPLGQKLIIGSTFENGFEATLTLKSNVLRAEGGGGVENGIFIFLPTFGWQS